MPSLKNKRIAIFGGAFDPPHRGHETALKAILRQLDPDRILVIPSGTPPHKEVSGKATGRQRLEMAKAAFLPLSDRISVLDLEISSSEVSYSYQTVEKIRQEYPNAELYLFVGTDQFLAFQTWKNVPYLLKECTLCVMERYENKADLFLQKGALEKEFGARCLLLEEKAYIISSSQIREELEKQGFSRSLSPKVNDYIALHALYWPSDSRREKLLSMLRQNLSPKRLSHTLAVERETVILARLFGYEREEDLRLAALIHDLTKEMSLLEHKMICAGENQTFTAQDRESPAVLHGKSAAVIARQLGLSEECICAVRYHTTARVNMTLPEKILYFADFIEETRTHEVCRRFRTYFYENLPTTACEREAFLDEQIRSSLEETVRNLSEKNLPIHPDTLDALEFLKNERKNHDPI